MLYLKNNYMSFQANFTHNKEPRSNHEGKNNENWVKVKKKQELDAHEINHTQELTNFIQEKR